MLLRLMAVTIATLSILGATASASFTPSKAIQIAEATTVVVRAHIHIHYLTDSEIQKLLKPSKAASFYGNKQKHTEDAPAPAPDEDRYDEIVCTGFVASSTGTEQTIVTARHCTQPDYDYIFGIPVDRADIVPTRVEFYDGDSATVTGVVRAGDSDLALLTVSSLRPHTTVAALSPNPPTRGQPLEVLGSAAGRKFMLSTAMSDQGDVETTAAREGADFAGLWLLECASCYAGDSGAGVFDEDGLVMGVLDATADLPAVAAMVPSYRISELLLGKH